MESSVSETKSLYLAKVAVWADVHVHIHCISGFDRGVLVCATHYWIVPCQKEDCFCGVFLDVLKL